MDIVSWVDRINFRRQCCRKSSNPRSRGFGSSSGCVGRDRSRLADGPESEAKVKPFSARWILNLAKCGDSGSSGIGAEPKCILNPGSLHGTAKNGYVMRKNEGPVCRYKARPCLKTALPVTIFGFRIGRGVSQSETVF